MSRRIELWISIGELNEQGEYSSVELHPGKDISTGGVFQLRQVRGRRQLAIFYRVFGTLIIYVTNQNFSQSKMLLVDGIFLAVPQVATGKSRHCLSEYGNKAAERFCRMWK